MPIRSPPEPPPRKIGPGRIAVSDETHLRGWLRLARCPQLAARHAVPLGRRLGPAVFAEPSHADLVARGVDSTHARALADAGLTRRIEQEITRAAREGWHLLGLDDPRYPTLVAQLAVPPPVLSVRGQLDALTRPGVAIVGSRSATSYGISMAESLAGGLARHGIAVVSGLALGVDGRAHRATLRAGGTTLAVLGTGLDVIYPRAHRRLTADIASHGAVLSELPPGTPPKPGHFPRRNRIIVGLSDAVVVVEAAIPSGTLVTARWATEENRALLAVPGRVGDPAAAGCLELLRDGAALATSVEDVLAEMRPERIPRRAEPDADGQESALAGLGPMCGDVLSAIPAHDDRSVDELLDLLPGSADRILAALFELELSGLVVALPGARYRRATGG